jgi:hypothetical protein
VLRPGRIFVLYIGGYAVGRFLVESLRSDKANEILGLRVNIWTSIVTFVGVLIFLAVAGFRRRPGDNDEPYYDGHRWDREHGRIEPSDPDATEDELADDGSEVDGGDEEGSERVTDVEDPEAEEPAGSAGEQRS